MTKAKVAPKVETKDEDTKAEKASMSSTMLKYRKGYEPSLSAAGRKSLNNGDDIAHLLSSLDARDVVHLAEKALGLKANELWDKYAHLNRGQQRMNAGNRIRGAVKRGDLTVAAVKKVLKAG